MIAQFSYTNVLLDQARQKGDELADQTLASIYRTDNPRKLLVDIWQMPDNQALIDNEFPDFIQKYFHVISTSPAWQEPDKLLIAWDFFEKYAQEWLGMLGFLSLPYCYAGEFGANVLHISTRLQAQTERRLFETAKFVLDLMQPTAFQPKG